MIAAVHSISSNEGTVTVTGKESAKMFAKNSSADNYTITNKGTINLNTVSGTPEKSVGMYAEIATTATGTTTLKNENTITVDQGNSVGMYILNNTADKSKAVVKNDTAGKIETKKASSVGILANKGTVNFTLQFSDDVWMKFVTFQRAVCHLSTD